MASRKKDFKDPTLNFFSPETIEADGKEEPQEPHTVPGDIPDEYRLNPMYIEKRTRRVQILLPPSVYKALKNEADEEGVSTNEIINRALKAYTERG